MVSNMSTFQLIVGIVVVVLVAYPIAFFFGYRAGVTDTMDVVIEQNKELNRRRKHENTNI